MEEDLVRRGKEIYSGREEELEQKYGGEIVAIDVDSGDIVGHGNTLSEAAKNADKEDEGNLYFQRVGREYAAKLM